MFEDFINDITYILGGNNNELELQVREVRDRLQHFITEDRFRYSCLMRVLDSYEQTNNKEKWVCPPIFHDTNLNFSVRIIFWPAFYHNNPHKHKTWGVTGVFSGKIDVGIYDEDVNRSITQIKLIKAQEKEVGYILPECIHSVYNPAGDISVSFHVFNNLPGIASSEENAIWYPSPKKFNLIEGLSTRVMYGILKSIEMMEPRYSREIAEKIYHLGTKDSKICAIQFISNRDKLRAKNLFEKFLIE